MYLRYELVGVPPVMEGHWRASVIMRWVQQPLLLPDVIHQPAWPTF